MTQIDIVPANTEDVLYVGEHMRQADREEGRAATGIPAQSALHLTVLGSKMTLAGLADGIPVCVFGLGHASIISEIARPWLVGTDEIEHYQFAFLRHNKAIVHGWAADHYLLENWVDARHEASIRWLRWLGFNILPKEPFGPFKMNFHRFEMRRAA